MLELGEWPGETGVKHIQSGCHTGWDVVWVTGGLLLACAAYAGVNAVLRFHGRIFQQLQLGCDLRVLCATRIANSARAAPRNIGYAENYVALYDDKSHIIGDMMFLPPRFHAAQSAV